MYTAIRRFIDLQDNNFSYSAGDKFPRGNKTVSEERLAELAGENNKLGVPLIVKNEEKPTKKAKARK